MHGDQGKEATEFQLPTDQKSLTDFLEYISSIRNQKNGKNMTEKKETIASLPGFGMAPEGHLAYSAGLNMRARRTPSCLVLGRIDPIPPQG